MIKKIRNFKFVIRNCQAGMTYVELIVVLSIFSVMSSVVLFNYKGFESNIDIRVLSNDVALKIVEAQKSSVSGKLPPSGKNSILNWKPAYGVYFDPDSPQHFIYFVDLNNSNFFSSLICSGECLNDIIITKGNKYKIESCTTVDCSNPDLIEDPLSITFKRPNSGATFSYSDNTSITITSSVYVRITVYSSDDSVNPGYIKIYPSGRIQIN
ncbi:MAG: hypothetical protein UR25_C0003G0022 [Candidatus Nomurabacteria bacterium GW2011_GWE1_32_28]|uniref:Uncharacterized protein n=1 Tax=Candidatus Nomurabacteria bacterium GW2011_GWF1_31_48 TaxID=1618767 RepID=A0A0F9YF02_9BACT|nr:MAG: hypothetical protein UR10_C0003G0022 [Candidatus Nomurabacteria bacterium GW2011_GWF2_30_133]KKP28662.1 MAG: hypothetical protein UR18_C0002G0074 [Candidatus Nomurabacteria bacterium GW2011_GWE2_31_40]KKP30239.1 MAG: hypothetical protein UR19_C0003G0075 [Candidatus Nomurabacteria bacterium GW2011_GWF1_31_48]KKP34766.1 MAG: hypothetical protein UR25_C0003G0022 [Candidatus Nomurabacteria bacterium GW2011_GWE1_32_28]HAS80776.1 hypothetical protein [Candidatus Nomurabacteria bacterium]